MKLNNATLDRWLETAPDSEYHNSKKIEYHTFYKAFKIVADEIHAHVTASANFKEAENGVLMFLNDHGPKHIETVIDRASKLVEGAKVELNPKEVYYLLTAIHLHDIGNLHGRANHVEDLHKVFSDLEKLINLDTIGKRQIMQIAMAHGGKMKNGNKDKIDILDEKVSTLEGDVRLKLLAAILRLADELADDKNRANNPLLLNGGLGDSEIFHAYSYCLSNVSIRHELKQIELEFHIPEKFATKKYGSSKKKKFLIDEIYDRVLKMHHERHYTMRFTRGDIDLTNLLVRIEFYPDSFDQAFLHDKITFELREKGYPNTGTKSIFEICDTLKQNGKNVTGAFIKKQIAKNKLEMNE